VLVEYLLRTLSSPHHFHFHDVLYVLDAAQIVPHLPPPILLNLSRIATTQMEQMRLPKSYKTPKQVAAELNLSERTVCRLCQSGELPSYRIGGRWRIYEEAELLVEDSDMVLKQIKRGMKQAGW
jgi:excisionase family DNA binding protein